MQFSSLFPANTSMNPGAHSTGFRRHSFRNQHLTPQPIQLNHALTTKKSECRTRGSEPPFRQLGTAPHWHFERRARHRPELPGNIRGASGRCQFRSSWPNRSGRRSGVRVDRREVEVVGCGRGRQLGIECVQIRRRGRLLGRRRGRLLSRRRGRLLGRGRGCAI